MEMMDPSSRRWIEHLRFGHARHEHAVSALHDVLHRAAVHELSRRRHQLWSIKGPEFDDLAQQAADDALVTILSKLDEFRGHSRFTTWAYSFVIFEVSAKVARHWWRREPPSAEETAVDDVPGLLASQPEKRFEQLTQFATLSSAIDELTARQREVFVAVALNEVPIDVVALRLDSNRNAVYKTLFDARRNLRRSLAAAGVPIGADERNPAATAITQPGSAEAAWPGATPRCVIVDDSSAVLHAARDLLEGQGISVAGLATTSDAALRLVAEHRPDVVLVDIDLGPESGLELTRRIGAVDGQRSPCILISTHSETDYAELIADSPAIGFLGKSELSAEAIQRLLAAARDCSTAPQEK
jgi:RNA polymerase sigma-70 factor (ECF subfamily)